MTANQPLWPREWLMTDERLGDRLWEAIEALPKGAGIVFRHYRLTRAMRLDLGLSLASLARERDLLLAVAGSMQLAKKLDAVLVHNPDQLGSLPYSMAVHDEHQADLAASTGASLTFVGPVHATRSHPGAPNLGIDRAATLARRAGFPAIALGGMDRARFAQLELAHPGAFHGFGGIDCWLGNPIKT